MKRILKKISNFFLYHLLFSLCFTYTSFAQSEQIPLWKKIPNAKKDKNYKEEPRVNAKGEKTGIRKVINPTITPYLVENGNDNNSAVIICPGGGYSVLSFYKEGIDVAKYLNSIGVSAFVLKYRLPSDAIMKDKTIGPLQDAQQAMRLVRKNAKKWNINPNKIGIMGFSAGGHLASTLSTHYNDKVYESDDISARPDFSILIYPVISMEDEITHNGSKTNLLGKSPSQELADFYSNEKQINANTPPTFLIHATNDSGVPVENSIRYYLNLKNNKVKTEMHLYEDGGHGFGLGKKGTNTAWPKALQNWLKNHQLTDENSL